MAGGRILGRWPGLARRDLYEDRDVRPTTDYRSIFKTMLRDARKHRSLNAGWPEAAMAGALGLAIAGPRRYGDTVVRIGRRFV